MIDLDRAANMVHLDDDQRRRAAGCVAMAVAGVASHVVYWNRGEHHNFAHRWIKRGLVAVALLAGAVFRLTGYQVCETAVMTSLLTASYFTGLYMSLFAYRLLFHPLRRFPGPFWAKWTNLYHAYIIRKSDNYFVVERLHKKYGPIVRTGPHNLSINTVEAVKVVLGNGSKCTKGPWYERSKPLVSLHISRSKKEHDARRKVFSKAFTPSALQEYETRVVQHCDEWIKQMKTISGKPFNASNWLKYFAFDVMGDVALGKEFHMMTSPQNRWIPELLETSMSDVGPSTPTPWLGPMLAKIPKKGGGDARSWLEFVGSQVKERVEKNVEREDVLSRLVEAYKESPRAPIDYTWLRGDTRLAIVGGSDTTASTLTFLFYHLAQDPSQVEKLRAELEPLLDGKNFLEQKDVSKAKHLDGVIQESLRMHPAIPSGFPRITPPEGITIGETFIPGGMTVVLPVYAMQRDEENYERATEFIPERWYSQPELIKQRDAFLTWNIGTNGCIGRALAVVEMRDLITAWIQNFKGVRFAPGEDGSGLLLGTLDHFTVGVKPMNLVFDQK